MAFDLDISMSSYVPLITDNIAKKTKLDMKQNRHLYCFHKMDKNDLFMTFDLNSWTSYRYIRLWGAVESSVWSVHEYWQCNSIWNQGSKLPIFKPESFGIVATWMCLMVDICIQFWKVCLTDWEPTRETRRRMNTTMTGSGTTSAV